jgi:RND family efflux transporter MFP subunit
MNTSLATLKRRPLLLALAAAGVLLAGTAWTLAVRADDKAPPAAAVAQASPAAKPALSVSVVQPQTADLAITVAANGSIAPWQEASVGAEAQGLRLAEVHVNVGDRVRRGQVLATFSNDTVQADLAQIRAAVAEADALLADARANAARARELDATGALSAQQINQFLTAERTAEARVAAQRAALQAQELRLRQTRVLAPDDGVISARSATVGAVVPAGMELFRLIRGGRLEWRAEVAAADLAQLKPGQAVRVQPSGAQALQGTLRMVAPTLDAATRNAVVFVDLPRPTAGGDGLPPGGVKAGMFARGEFAVGHSDGLTLPASAVLLRDGFSYVFEVAADSRVAQRKVAVGRRVGDRVEITSGLKADARVVESGAGFLADGDTVRVVPRPAAAAALPQLAGVPARG